MFTEFLSFEDELPTIDQLISPHRKLPYARFKSCEEYYCHFTLYKHEQFTNRETRVRRPLG